MKLAEFLLERTKGQQMCAILDSGCIIETAYIDHEDLYIASIKNRDREVKCFYWSTLDIRTQHGDKLSIPCRYIELK